MSGAGPGALLLLACLLLTPALLTAGQVEPVGGGTLLVVAAGVLVATLALTATVAPGTAPARRATGATTLLIGLSAVNGAVSTAVSASRLAASWWAPRAGPGIRVTAALVLAVALVGVLAAARTGRLRGRPLGLVAATGTAAVVLLVHLSDPLIDVLVFQRDAAAALVTGSNPYALTFPDPYPPEASRLFYGPGVSVDGRLQVGFPYPPVSLLMILPAYLLGDVRYAMCAALVVAALAIRWVAPDRSGRACAVLLALIPASVLVLVNGWTEPLVLVLLAGTVVAARRRPAATGYLLGLLLLSKQYLVLALPLLWLLRPAARAGPGGTRGFLLRAAATGVLSILPFLLWDPRAFLDSVVAFQFRQPFRADSVSLLAWLVNRTGWPPAAVYGWLPLLAGFGAAVLVAWRAPRTPAAFAGGVGVTLLVTLLLSKQAFANYYFLGVGALLIAAATWQRAEVTGDPAAAPEPPPAPPAPLRPAPRRPPPGPT